MSLASRADRLADASLFSAGAGAMVWEVRSFYSVVPLKIDVDANLLLLLPVPRRRC